jgi:transposase InsO family protein
MTVPSDVFSKEIY